MDKQTMYWAGGIVVIIVVLLILGYYEFGWFGTAPGQTQ